VGDLGGWLEPAAVWCLYETSRGRYGGRAERGTKTAFRGGMVTTNCGPRTVESDTLGKYRVWQTRLSASLCVVKGCVEWNRNSCYRGLWKEG
jgi:hypothetical protein